MASGSILAAFGAFLIFTDFYVPLGVSTFGLPFLIAGGIMFSAGFFRKEPLPVVAARGKKFCWYCMAQIPKAAKECPNCTLPQYGPKV